jgi:Mg2+ and Co2+ transporter CorA
MANTFFHLTTLAALAVLAVLVAGLWAMSREGTASLSQKLMRWRVGLQFMAIIIIMLAVYFKRKVGA